MIKKIKGWLDKRFIKKINNDLKYVIHKKRYGERGTKLLYPKRKQKDKKVMKLSPEIIKKIDKKNKRKKLYLNFKMRFFPRLLILIGVVLLITIPIIYNFIIKLPSTKAVGTNSDWIAFYGSYLGGLLGGLVTLIGVRQTIKDSTQKHFLDNYPTKEINLSKLITKIEKLKNDIRDCESIDEIKDLLSTFKNEEERIRRLAIQVSPTTYETINKFFEYINLDSTYSIFSLELSYKLNKDAVYDEIENYLRILKIIQKRLFNSYVNSSDIV